MRPEKNLSLLRLAYFHLKSLKLLYFVPLVFLFILLPFFSFGHFLSFGLSENTYYQTFAEFQRYIPFMACWWIIFGLREYVEGDGKELLHVYKKNLFFDFLIIFIWYLIHIIILFTLYGIFFHNYWMDFFLILIQSLVYAGTTFFLMVVCKTIAVPFLINIFYEIFCMYSNLEILRYINMLSVPRIEHFEDLLLPYLPLFIAAFSLVIAGNKIYQKRVSLI